MTALRRVWFVVLAAAIGAALGACETHEAPDDRAAEHADEHAAEHGDEHAHADGHAEEARGPHGGRVLADGDFAIELAIFETGVPPEFHAWATHDGAAVAPGEVELTVALARLGGRVDRIAFVPSAERLRGTTPVTEPHSFDVTVTARYAGAEHRWTYESHEGRTTIAADLARAAGIETQIAGPATIAETAVLYGTIAVDPARVRRIGARFPGEIKTVAVALGDRVAPGATIATVEANESLQRYSIASPIAGVVTTVAAASGEQTGSEPLVVVTDLATVWAELAVFPGERAKVVRGVEVRVTAGDGTTARGTIDYIAPFGDAGTQSTRARVALDNAAGSFMPGQFVEAQAVLGTTRVELAVPRAALQTFNDFDVVFARFGDEYEVRMLELGREDAERVEVLDGLEAGTEIVVAGSYVVKADIEKAGASHDH